MAAASKTIKLGLIGCGSIGTTVLAAIDAGRAPGVACTGVLVRRPRPGNDDDGRLVADADAFFAHSYDLVVECAGHEALRQHGGRVLAVGSDLMTVSMGALADPALLTALEKSARSSGTRLILLSAAIGALDILSAAAEGGLEEVKITVASPPETLRRSPAAALLDLDHLAEPASVYAGPVREGAKLYPHNANIAAAVALAGPGLDATWLEIRTEPGLSTYRIEISASGAFGRFRFEEELTIDPASGTHIAHLLPQAVIKAIRQYASPVVIGG